jgi:hypothetical protein
MYSERIKRLWRLARRNLVMITALGRYITKDFKGG